MEESRKINTKDFDRYSKDKCGDFLKAYHEDATNWLNPELTKMLNNLNWSEFNEMYDFVERLKDNLADYHKCRWLLIKKQKQQEQKDIQKELDKIIN